MRSVLFLLFLIVVVPSSGLAQTTYQMGLLPSININKRFHQNWSVNFKAESRQALLKGSGAENSRFDFDYQLTDLSLVAAKRIAIGTSLGMGYQIRIDEEMASHRAIQQLSYVRRYPGIILSHRFAADQTFSGSEKPEYRFRYRLASEIPLQGQTLDPREFFIKLNNEYLNSFQDGDYDLEIRAVGFIGYTISPAGKMELGLDYRVDSFLNGLPRNRFWIGLNYFHSIR